MFSNIKNHGVAKDSVGWLRVPGVFVGSNRALGEDQTHVSYNIPAGGSLVVNVPATNTPVSFTCVHRTPWASVVSVGPRFCGFSRMLSSNGSVRTLPRAPSPPAFPALPERISSIATSSKTVDVQVSSDVAIQLVNTNTVAMTGEINWVW